MRTGTFRLWSAVAGISAMVGTSFGGPNYLNLTSGQAYPVAGYVLLNTNGHPAVPASTRVFETPQVNGTFYPSWVIYMTSSIGGGWNGASPPAPATGLGLVILPGANCTLGVPDVLPDPVLPLNLPPGFSLVCCQKFQFATFEDIVGRAPDVGTQVYQYTNNLDAGPLMCPGNTNFAVYTFTTTGWVPSDPVAAPGEAVWVLQPPKIVNPQLNGTTFQFQTLTVPNAVVGVQFRDSLDPVSFWQPLTNLVGVGNFTNVFDDLSANGASQRFYRLNLQTNQ
jgi:hypothetical protein